MSATSTSGGVNLNPSTQSKIVKSRIPVKDSHEKLFDSLKLHKELVDTNLHLAEENTLEMAMHVENLNILRNLKSEIQETDWMFNESS